MTPARPAAAPVTRSADRPHAVFEADFRPSAAGRFVILGCAAAVAAGGVALVGAGVQVLRAGVRPPAFDVFVTSWVVLASAALTFWLNRFEVARVWFRVTPRRAEWERIWWGVRRAGAAELTAGDGLIDCDGPWYGGGGRVAIAARLGGRRVQLTPRLPGREGAEIRAGVAGAVGVAPPARMIEPCFRFADPHAPPHPAVMVERDARGRTVVTMPLRIDGRRVRGVFRLFGLALAVAVTAALGWSVADGRRDGLAWATAAVATAAGWALGLGVAATPAATVRVTVGAGRVAVRTGWGRWRAGRNLRIDGVRAVVVVAHHEGVWLGANAAWATDPTARLRPFRRRPTAALVRRRRPTDLWPRVVPFSGRGADDPAGLAAAAAAAVAAALAEHGFEPDPPSGWQFSAGADDAATIPP